MKSPLLLNVCRENGFFRSLDLFIKTLRELSWMEWLRVTCFKCREDLTQYLTPQNKIRLAARTFETRISSNRH